MLFCFLKKKNIQQNKEPFIFILMNIHGQQRCICFLKTKMKAMKGSGMAYNNNYDFPAKKMKADTLLLAMGSISCFSSVPVFIIEP